ncbi:MFS transporter [Bradyrhizobium elkanii]|uniref:MFS transporter n=1 Tax=Bradyrhizobium elkanii TaxID=29448 RepID=UPI001BAC52D3|nr:MFS transporter [Bradyrhizobium elkanii]MBR1162254.1 MFS transporter [Bradyrhizobium elkanii]
MQQHLHHPSVDRTPPSSLRRAVLLPGLVAMFGLASLGAPLAVLPVRVDADLGFGPLVAGAVLAAEGLATLLTRPLVGRFADRRRARDATMLGLFGAVASGAFYLLAGVLPVSAFTALGLMVTGRVAMGIGQGFLFSGGTAWAVILAGPAQQGRAMSWVGLLFFAGISAGALLGGLAGDIAHLLTTRLPPQLAPDSFLVAAAITMLVPLGGLPLVLIAQRSAPSPHGAATVPLTAILGAIWRPTLGFGLAVMSYIGTTSFVVLAFLHRGWHGGSIALFAFLAAFALARPVFSGVCDRTTGPRPVLLALAALAGGMLILGLAPDEQTAIAGAIVAGCGMSMTYPLLALPVVRAVPVTQIASGIGLFDAAYDVATLITPPLAGLIAATVGYFAVFLVLAGISLLAMIPAAAAWRRRPAVCTRELRADRGMV